VIPLDQPSTLRRRVSLRIEHNSVGAMLWRNRVCSPVWPVKEGSEVCRERGLLNVGAVGICRVDALSAVDQHAKQDSRTVR
jgi:hypothetical protein